LAGSTAVARVRIWAKSAGFSSPIEYVFEDGDRGKGKLIERMQRDGLPIPVFKPKQDQVKDGVLIPAFTPLQPADLCAYEFILATRKVLSRQLSPDDGDIWC